MRAHWIALALGLTVVSCNNGGGSGGGLSLMFEAPDGSGYVGGQVNEVNTSGVSTVFFTLKDAVTINGQVTDGGAPVANVEVLYKAYAGALAMDSATTDVNGDYTVEVSSGMWVVELETGIQALGTQQITGVSIVGPGPVTEDFQIPATFVVDGIVSEAFGPAIANALVDPPRGRYTIFAVGIARPP